MEDVKLILSNESKTRTLKQCFFKTVAELFEAAAGLLVSLLGLTFTGKVVTVQTEFKVSVFVVGHVPLRELSCWKNPMKNPVFLLLNPGQVLSHDLAHLPSKHLLITQRKVTPTAKWQLDFCSRMTR